MTYLFAYGSLSLPEVVETVTGRTFTSVRATAPDYDRYLLRGRPYPGLVRRPGAMSDGRLYFDVDSTSLELLDRFEDDCYERVTIDVRLDGELPMERADRIVELCSGRIKALAYVVPERHASEVLSEEPWNESFFRAVYLDNYLRMCDSFYRQPPPPLSYSEWE